MLHRNTANRDAMRRRSRPRRDRVREARRFLTEILNGCPTADDVLLTASELASNAILPSASGQPGGAFTLTAEVREGKHVQIEIHDQGGPWNQRNHKDVRPHGLDIVASLATRHGVSGDPLAGWTAWAVLPWHPAPAPKTTTTERTPPMTTTTTEDTRPATASTLPTRRPRALRTATPSPAEPPGYDLDQAWELLATTCDLPATERGLLKVLTEYRKALHALAAQLQATQGKPHATT